MSPTLAGDAVTELERESSTVDLEPVGLALTPASYVTTAAVLIALGFASRSHHARRPVPISVSLGLLHRRPAAPRAALEPTEPHGVQVI